MIYLLNVSALLALGFANHEFHARFTAWLDRLAKDGLPEFATCSITELGFVRILSQTGHYGIHIPVEEARRLLLRLKSSRFIGRLFPTATISPNSLGGPSTHGR